MLLKYLFWAFACITLAQCQSDENLINDFKNQNQNNQLTEHDIFTRLIQNLKNSHMLSSISSTTVAPTSTSTTLSSSTTPQPPNGQQFSFNSLYSKNSQVLPSNIAPAMQNDVSNIFNDFLRLNHMNIPIVAVLQPILIPFPFLMNSQQFSANNNHFPDEYDDTMSRDNLRRPSNPNYRNSPIYYVRLPPTPYTFLPNLNSLNNLIGRNYPTPSTASFMPIHSLPTISTPTSSNFQSTLSSILNLPVNFLANGKPTNVYNLEGNNDLQQQFYQQQQQFNTNNNNNYGLSHNSYNSPTNYNTRPGSDSKITNLKRQYLFNGRPDDHIYFLSAPQANHFNSLYSNSIPPEYL